MSELVISTCSHEFYSKNKKKMCKMRPMSTQERAIAVGMVQAGRSLRGYVFFDLVGFI